MSLGPGIGLARFPPSGTRVWVKNSGLFILVIIRSHRLRFVWSLTQDLFAMDGPTSSYGHWDMQPPPPR